MSYNKKLFKQMVEESKQKKTSPNPFGKDKILDPLGQWKFPGQVTRIPSNRITMQGVPYPVLAKGSSGAERVMYPDQEYFFPDSTYVDEYPLVKAQNGINLNLPKYNKPEDKQFSVNPYTFGFNPAPGVNIFGIGANPSLNLLNTKKDRLALTGDISSVSVGYPGGQELFTKPQYGFGVRYTRNFETGGDISIPNLEEGNWLDRYDKGGQATLDKFYKNLFQNINKRVSQGEDASFGKRALGAIETVVEDPLNALNFLFTKKQKLSNPWENPYGVDFISDRQGNIKKTWAPKYGAVDNSITTETTRPPIYVDNPNDPRLKAHNDSLYYYNQNPKIAKEMFILNRALKKYIESNNLKQHNSGVLTGTTKESSEKEWNKARAKYKKFKESIGLIGIESGATNSKIILPRVPNPLYKRGTDDNLTPENMMEFTFKKPVQPYILQEQPQLKMVGNERRDISPSFNTRIPSPNIPSIARPDNKYMVSYTDEEGVGREEYFPTAELADQYMDWRRANNMFYGTGMSRRGVFQGGGSLPKFQTRGEFKLTPNQITDLQKKAEIYNPKNRYGQYWDNKIKEQEQQKKAEEEKQIQERKNAAATRKKVIAGDENATFTFPDGKTKAWKDMDWREQSYVSGKNLGSFNNNNWTDYVNPLAMIGSMGEGLGTSPYVARETNSIMPYVTGVGAPLLTGALAGAGAKTTGQFVNNLVNPLAGVGSKPAVSSSVDNVAQSVTPKPWQLEELPGLHLKSTMEGEAISKIVEPKTGLINTEQALAIIGKESRGADKVALIRQGLGDKIPKKMDFNEFRKVVQDQLIPLERQFATHSSNYGIGKLGYPNAKRSSYDVSIQTTKNAIAKGEDIAENEIHLKKLLNEYNQLPLENQTLILSNKNKFGRGSAEHNNPEETLGHIHFLRDAETPDVLTVTQIQSDAFQGTYKSTLAPKEVLQKSLERMEQLQKRNKAILNKMKTEGVDEAGVPVQDYQIKQFEDLVKVQEKSNLFKKADIENFTQKQLLDKNHQERYLQELVDYAGKRGDINKVRVPTSETAAKVQGYNKVKIDDDNLLSKLELEELKSLSDDYSKMPDDVSDELWDNVYSPMRERMNTLNAKRAKEAGYSPEHQTILKKYSEQPKTIKKLFGKEPTIVTDSKGNTWYEFDIPEKFKKGKAEIKAFGLAPFVGIGGAGILGAGALQQKKQGGGENDGVQRIKIKNNDGTYSYLRSDSKEYYDLIQSGAIDESSFNQKDTAFSLKQKPKKVIQAPVVKKDEGPSFLDNLTSNFSNLYSKFRTAINEAPLDARGITIANGFSGLQPRKINLPSKQTIQTIATAPLLIPAVGLNNLANKVVEYTNILANMWDRRGFEGWEDKPDDVVATRSLGIPKAPPSNNKENNKTPLKSIRNSSFQMGDYIDSENYNTHKFIKLKERLVHTPTFIDLNDDNLTYGYRNRNEYKDINTPGLFITTVSGKDPLDDGGKNSIRKYKDSEIIDTGGYIGIDDNGKLFVDYGKNLKGKNLKAMTDIDFIDGVTGFAKSGNTYKYGDETDNNDISKVAHLQLKDGKTHPNSMILVNRHQDLKSQENLFGKNTGGKAIIASPDLKYKIYIAGSIKDIDNAIQEFKNFYGLDYVKYGRLDNGSYKQPLQTKSGKIDKTMLKRYDALNFTGGNAFYLNPIKKNGGETNNWLNKYN